MLLYCLQVECVIISLTTLQYFLMTTAFIAWKYGFISLMNKPIVNAGFSKKVVNVHRRDWMRNLQLCCIIQKTKSWWHEWSVWIPGLFQWFEGREVVVWLFVSKLLSPTCFIFFIFSPWQNHAFDSFVCLQLSFSFVPPSLPNNTEQWESLCPPSLAFVRFCPQLILKNSF